MPKFRKRPVVIEAEQFKGGVEVGGYKIPKGVCYCSDGDDPETFVHQFHLHTIHKDQIVVLETGDWILPEPDGKHYYPCKPDIFARTFDLADIPLFTVLGTDPFGQGTIVNWIDRARAGGVAEDKLNKAIECHQEFVDFQSAHPERVKVPD